MKVFGKASRIPFDLPSVISSVCGKRSYFTRACLPSKTTNFNTIFKRNVTTALATDLVRDSSLHPNALNQPPCHVTTLKNGLRVATVWMPGYSSTVGVWIDSGSRFETPETNGAAHFLEHMIFKGTKSRTRQQLEEQIEHKGAHLNAYTSREQTAYYARCFNNDVPWCTELLSDILQNSLIDSDIMETEKHVILREMEEVEKSHEEVLFDRLHMAAFRDDSLGYTILGPVENIKNMQREYLLDYVRRNYTADRMVLCGVGNFDHDKFVALAEKEFSTVPKATSKVVFEKPYFVGSELVERDDTMGPYGYIAVALEGLPWNSPDSVVLMLMQSIIGTYNKSNEGIVPGKVSGNRTIHAIANRMTVGCAEFYSAFNTCYKDTGLFGFYCKADEVAVEHCVGELMFGITSLSYSVTDEEVERAKRQLMLQFLSSTESTSNVAEEVARQILVYGRRMPVAEFLLRLEKIDAEEVKRVAWKYLHDSEVALTAVGALHGLHPLHELRQKTFWLRY
ncbi:mitochondrial processing peptidase [Theileria orientalis]|uniref:Mitochondrial processing peptidase n=1 Tax=Theileria orientalis TaxID=68886 RepID=A0A976QU48_THEOR|nr:mitochondrial processing peptidase [Theileria orientalis]